MSKHDEAFDWTATDSDMCARLLDKYNRRRDDIEEYEQWLDQLDNVSDDSRVLTVRTRKEN